MSPPITNVVLVHGGFVDGSGWQQVHDLLIADGFHVAVVQNPTLELDDTEDLTSDEKAELAELRGRDHHSDRRAFAAS